VKTDPISKALGEHYAEKFSAHGATSEGVDWGPDETRAQLRYEKMLAVADFSNAQRSSWLDVGCGYGGLLQYAAGKGLELDYTGIDVAANMIEWARANMPNSNFIHGDILDQRFDREFDYVVCNGILTQKLAASGQEMDQFAAQLIRRLFSLCKVGVAFNVMTTKVNYFVNNLYYRNPAELMSWCLDEITPHLRLDHSYPLYEYTLYLYRHPIPERTTT
jgi:SAM-dependent methyltransferase